jgi:hypothetical protein
MDGVMFMFIAFENTLANPVEGLIVRPVGGPLLSIR